MAEQREVRQSLFMNFLGRWLWNVCQNLKIHYVEWGIDAGVQVYLKLAEIQTGISKMQDWFQIFK